MTKKFISRFGILFILVFLVGILASSAVFAKTTLTVGWEDWPPHQMNNENGELVGVNIELMNEMAKRAGFELKFREVPWTRNLKELEQGKIDIAMSASKTEERAKYAYFSDAYFKLEYNVMVVKKKNMKKYSSIKTLKDVIGTDFIIGVNRGSIYSDEHAVLVKNPDFVKQVRTANTVKQNLQKMMSDRVTGVIGDELTVASIGKELGYDGKISILFYLYSEEDAAAYLMFSKASMTKEQVARMDKALADMRADGTYKKILSKYQLKKGKKWFLF